MADQTAHTAQQAAGSSAFTGRDVQNRLPRKRVIDDRTPQKVEARERPHPPSSGRADVAFLRGTCFVLVGMGAQEGAGEDGRHARARVQNAGCPEATDGIFSWAVGALETLGASRVPGDGVAAYSAAAGSCTHVLANAESDDVDPAFLRRVADDGVALVNVEWLEDALTQAGAVPDAQERVPGAEHLAVCGTGFHGESRRWLRETVRQLGARYSSHLIQGDTTHLVLADTGAGGEHEAGQKLVRARQWGVQVVRREWLAQVLQTRTLPTGAAPTRKPRERVDTRATPVDAATAADVSAVLEEAADADQPGGNQSLDERGGVQDAFRAMALEQETGSEGGLAGDESSTEVPRTVEAADSTPEPAKVDAFAARLRTAESSARLQAAKPPSRAEAPEEEVVDARAPVREAKAVAEVQAESCLAEEKAARGAQAAAEEEARRQRELEVTPVVVVAAATAAADVEVTPEVVLEADMSEADDMETQEPLAEPADDDSVTDVSPKGAGHIQREAETWGLWPVLSLGTAGLPVELTPGLETVVGRSAELRISARTISRQQLRVTLAAGTDGAAVPTLNVTAAQAVYVQRRGADAASPLAKGESTVLYPGDTLLLLLQLGKFHYGYQFMSKSAMEAAPPEGAAGASAAASGDPVATPWDCSATNASHTGEQPSPLDAVVVESADRDPPSAAQAGSAVREAADGVEAGQPLAEPRAPQGDEVAASDTAGVAMVGPSDATDAPLAEEPSGEEQSFATEWKAVSSVELIKSLTRVPKGVTVKDVHKIAPKAAKYAEQLVLTTDQGTVEVSVKKKTRCLVVKSKQGPMIAEPLAFYQLPSNEEWWMEYTPMYTHEQVRKQEHVVESEFAWPADFDEAGEVIRAPTSRRHTRLGRTCGQATVCKLRKRPSASRSATSKGSFFWTMMFDPDTLDILTDGPVTTLVAPDDNNNSSANADEHPDGMEAEDEE